MSCKERRILLGICGLALLSLLFFVFIGAKQKRSYTHSRNLRQARESELKRVEKLTAEEENNWSTWQQTLKDMDELRSSYLYSQTDLNQQLRRDLQEIFNQNRIQTPALGYEYSDFENERIKKVRINFDLALPYTTLRKLIHSVEQFHKLLMIEKIDFLDIGSQGSFKVRITLAAYYEG